jgi:hypothetical protein
MGMQVAEDEFFGKLKAQGKALKHVELLKFKVGQLQQRPPAGTTTTTSITSRTAGSWGWRGSYSKGYLMAQ